MGPQISVGTETQVHRLGKGDLADCEALAVSQDWGSEDHKWRLLFDIGEVYGIRDGAGRLISSATMTRYGPGAVAISMVLTAPDRQGEGLARRVMSHLLELAGDAVVSLYATDNGRPLYERLGFTAAASNTTHLGRFSGRPSGRTRVATDADLASLFAIDARVTGVDRSILVSRLPEFALRLRVVETGGIVTGYAGAWRNDTNTVIGPVIAADLTDATDLIADLAAELPGLVRLEVREGVTGLAEWAVANGIDARTVTTFMIHDGCELPGLSEHWFVPVMVALG